MNQTAKNKRTACILFGSFYLFSLIVPVLMFVFGIKDGLPVLCVIALPILLVQTVIFVVILKTAFRNIERGYTLAGAPAGLRARQYFDEQTMRNAQMANEQFMRNAQMANEQAMRDAQFAAEQTMRDAQFVSQQAEQFAQQFATDDAIRQSQILNPGNMGMPGF